MSHEEKSRHEGVFTVERILEKRIFKGKVKYLIKWKEFRVTESTWEPIENLGECKSMLEAFEKRQKRMQSKINRKNQNSEQNKEQIYQPRKKSICRFASENLKLFLGSSLTQHGEISDSKVEKVEDELNGNKENEKVEGENPCKIDQVSDLKNNSDNFKNESQILSVDDAKKDSFFEKESRKDEEETFSMVSSKEESPENHEKIYGKIPNRRGRPKKLHIEEVYQRKQYESSSRIDEKIGKNKIDQFSYNLGPFTILNRENESKLYETKVSRRRNEQNVIDIEERMGKLNYMTSFAKREFDLNKKGCFDINGHTLIDNEVYLQIANPLKKIKREHLIKLQECQSISPEAVNSYFDKKIVIIVDEFH